MTKGGFNVLSKGVTFALKGGYFREVKGGYQMPGSDA